MNASKPARVSFKQLRLYNITIHINTSRCLHTRSIDVCNKRFLSQSSRYTRIRIDQLLYWFIPITVPQIFKFYNYHFSILHFKLKSTILYFTRYFAKTNNATIHIICKSCKLHLQLSQISATVIFLRSNMNIIIILPHRL